MRGRERVDRERETKGGRDNGGKQRDKEEKQERGRERERKRARDREKARARVRARARESERASEKRKLYLSSSRLAGITRSGPVSHLMSRHSGSVTVLISHQNGTRKRTYAQKMERSESYNMFKGSPPRVQLF